MVSSDYSSRRFIWNKIKKASQIGQEQKTLIFDFV